MKPFRFSRFFPVNSGKEHRRDVHLAGLESALDLNLRVGLFPFQVAELHGL